MQPLETERPEVWAAWPGLTVDPAPYGTGLINETHLGRLAGAKVVVQRLHPAFAGTVHDDIEAVTSHLARKGLVTPRIVRTADGSLFAPDREGRPWRVLTHVEGQASDVARDTAHIGSAGALVGRFHAALRDLEHTYVHVRRGVHDLPLRFRGLERAIAASPSHRLHDAVASLAEDLFALEGAVLGLDTSPPRHAHGDLKLSNLLFDASGAGVCLVDLDTLASMPWPFEMGDALRSWCNPAGEDDPRPRVDEARFEAAVRGWAEGAAGHDLTREEVELLPAGLVTIATELSVRFATDALEERYFGWSPGRFAGRGEHNLARARGQLLLAKSARDATPRLARIAAAALGSGQ